MAIRHWMYGIGGLATTALLGLGINYLVNSGKTEETKNTGSYELLQSKTITTQVQIDGNGNPTVLYCLKNNSCVSRDKLYGSLDERLNEIDKKALHEARN